MIKDFVFFWKESPRYMGESIAWCLVHGWGACFRFMKMSTTKK
ncbi:hypothetical protein [Jeotgalibaca porci]|nr:hypothetical protein [Jeotgalibaca porci]